jgi:hypothetical protein
MARKRGHKKLTVIGPHIGHGRKHHKRGHKTHRRKRA